VEAAFPIVVFGSIALFIVVGILSMLTRTNNLYDQIGQDGLSLGEDQLHGGLPPEPGAFESPATRAEREQEIRQMLGARSERLVSKGQPPLDIEAELARLERGGPHGAGSHDVGLAEEVRQLVVARNERRRRQGKDLLDVETEVQRTLAELDP
jgi:hypothetical protein